ncbi:hypothetical protein BpHYR1_009743 [Brachionus plicatilis]|uniref:Uncharacterized protein n=1 Tax=Brachionus plicatilis TaxID=10195 RepID=A0A3M7R0K6_BRAPC|nr:hypothetical protein BpHYR1_009743 [Brachionus plicatilis]
MVTWTHDNTRNLVDKKLILSKGNSKIGLKCSNRFYNRFHFRTDYQTDKVFSVFVSVGRLSGGQVAGPKKNLVQKAAGSNGGPWPFLRPTVFKCPDRWPAKIGRLPSLVFVNSCLRGMISLGNKDKSAFEKLFFTKRKDCLSSVLIIQLNQILIIFYFFDIFPKNRISGKINPDRFFTVVRIKERRLVDLLENYIFILENYIS